MKATVKIEGLEEVLNVLRSMPELFAEGMDKGLQRGSEIVVNNARSKFAPHGTATQDYKASSRLRKHYSGKFPPHNITGKLSGAIDGWRDGKGKDYAVYHVGLPHSATRDEAIKANAVEFGHIASGWFQGMSPIGDAPPHPFLRPAFYESKKDVEKEVERALVEVVNKVNAG